MYIDPVPTKSQILFCVRGEVQEKGWELPLLSMLCLSVPTECGRRGFYLNIPCCPPDPGTHSTMWELSWAWAAAPECGGKSLVSALKTRSPLPCPSYYIETLPSHHFFFVTPVWEPQLLVSWQLTKFLWAWPGFTGEKSALHIPVVFLSPTIALVHKMNEIFSRGVVSRQLWAVNIFFIFRCQMSWHNQK